jgi:hypothetical protein
VDEKVDMLLKGPFMRMNRWTGSLWECGHAVEVSLYEDVDLLWKCPKWMWTWCGSVSIRGCGPA